MRRGGEVAVGDALKALRWSSNSAKRAELKKLHPDAPCAGWELMPIWHEALDKMPRDDMSYILAARRRGESTVKKPRVRLSTIHGAKGAQARHVVLHLEQAPRTAEETGARLEDEARVWYVAATRAMQKLTLVEPQGRHKWEM